MGERHHQSGGLGERDEVVRHHEAVLGVDPANECLDPGDRTGLEVGDGLVVEDELVAFDRAAQVAQERKPPG